MNKNKTVQPLSENTRKAIIIAAIVAVAVIILSISLALILRTTPLSPDDQQTPSTGSSSLSIKNGDFAYTNSDDTGFPRTAQNWSKYGYKKASGSSHEFDSITSNDKAVMGIVNVASKEDDDNAGWDNVKPYLDAEGLTNVTNPGVHGKINEDDEDSEDTNNNVYMIATKEPTTASILSESASVSSGASVKITVWLNTAQLAKGTKAVVMIQKSSISALSKNWYAYDFEIDQQSEYEKDENGWQKLEFYIFNREATSKYIRVSIGIGNVYSGENNDPGVALVGGEPVKGEGVLFIDDITYETVTANDYREQVDAEGAENSTMFKIIENEDIVDKSTYLTLATETEDYKEKLSYYEDAFKYAEDAKNFSPFTNRDDFTDEEGAYNGFKIYKLAHDGSNIEKPLALRLNAGELKDSVDNNINVKSSLLLKDHHHISFWVRVDKSNAVAYANVYIQKMGTDGWEDASSSSSWVSITTSQDIEEDTNCGWVKYDIYLKPSANPEQISILFVLGKKDNYTDEDRALGLIPDGDMYVTSPAYEKISYSDYNSASSGSNVKKIDLVGSSASTTISNGSFSTLDGSGLQPASWTPAFAGDNSIYRDGQNNLLSDLNRLAQTIQGSGTVQGCTIDGVDKPVSRNGVVLDDPQRNVLKIQNNAKTSFGYYSSDITLSSKTAYVISAMFRSDDSSLDPHIYLINTDTSLERQERIITSVTSKSQTFDDNTAMLLGYDFNEFDNGWVRYYMIVVTGDESMNVRLALFNGSIDGETQYEGSVYYDKVEMRTLGTYSFVEADDDEKEENADYETHYKVKWTDHKYITATKGNIAKYGKNFGELMEKTVSEEDNTLLLESWGIKVIQPTEDEWEEMARIPEENGEDETPSEGDTTREPSKVDLGLLFSVISSVALVAALLVVFVIKVYKNKGRITKAA